MTHRYPTKWSSKRLPQTISWDEHDPRRVKDPEGQGTVNSAKYKSKSSHLATQPLVRSCVYIYICICIYACNSMHILLYIMKNVYMFKY
jgi:hypothetical protein